MNATFAAVRAGHIEARVPGAGDSDELTELASNTNDMLDQVERLIEAQRAVSDQTAHEIRTPLMHLDTRILKAMEAAQEKAARTMEDNDHLDRCGGLTKRSALD